MDVEATRRRIKAARALADLTVEQLAERLGDARLGAKTLGKIERGERAVRSHELQLIATACELPYAFFQVDMQKLKPPGDPRADVVIEDATRDAVSVIVETKVRESVGPQLQELLRAVGEAQVQIATLYSEREVSVRDAARAVTASVADQLDNASPGAAAERETRDAEDATPEPTRARDAKTPSVSRRSAR